MNFGVEEATEVLEWAGFTVTAPRVNRSDLRRDPERLEELQALVKAGNSISEIQRQLKMDSRTIKRHFPYAGWIPGGGGDAAETRETNRQLREFLKRGKIGKHRENGFTPRD